MGRWLHYFGVCPFKAKKFDIFLSLSPFFFRRPFPINQDRQRQRLAWLDEPFLLSHTLLSRQVVGWWLVALSRGVVLFLLFRTRTVHAMKERFAVSPSGREEKGGGKKRFPCMRAWMMDLGDGAMGETQTRMHSKIPSNFIKPGCVFLALRITPYRIRFSGLLGLLFLSPYIRMVGWSVSLVGWLLGWLVPLVVINLFFTHLFTSLPTCLLTCLLACVCVSVCLYVCALDPFSSACLSSSGWWMLDWMLEW